MTKKKKTSTTYCQKSMRLNQVSCKSCPKRVLTLKTEEEPTSEPEGDQHFRHTGGDAVNSQLSVGYKDGRAFVVRGNQIGVFDSNQEDLKFRATIKDVKTLKGKAFAPNKVCTSDYIPSAADGFAGHAPQPRLIHDSHESRRFALALPHGLG